MVRERLAGYRDRVRAELRAAFREEHTPHQVAASFAIGVFVSALPTGGVGVGLFFVFVSLWSWVSKPAIFAAAVVLNPFVKPAVYVASFQVGAFALGAESVRSRDTTTGESAIVAVQQLLLGNLVIAAILSALSYGLVHYLTRLHRRQTDRRSVDSLSAPFRRD